MTYEIYRYIFIGGAILSAVMFIVSLLLLVFLKIPRVINDLTGRTAKKAIRNIREQNISSGEKKYKTSAVNAERGKLTDKISTTGSIIQKGGKSPMNVAVATEKISTQQLEGADETTVLYNEETSVLTPEQNLSGETDVLDSVNYPETAGFVIEFDITFVHTGEIIL